MWRFPRILRIVEQTVSVVPRPLAFDSMENIYADPDNVQGSASSSSETSLSTATASEYRSLHTTYLILICSGIPANPQSVKTGLSHKATKPIRPETYFWPVATVMRRKVQKFIEKQRDALAELDAELLALHYKHEAELKNLRQEVHMRQKMQIFIDGQRKSLTAMDAELLALNREHEAEQRKLRREFLGLD